MQNASHAIQAYKTASRYRSQRDQEADVFHHAIVALKGAKDAGPIQKIRALADNRRLWMTVSNLLSDPANALPEPLRVSILSVGATVQREMDQEAPDFEFLISINENIAAGLAGQP
ncbi:MAG: flagellar biosynthesis activator protein FlaF [Acetobacteraceae bacterium]|jgi:flagellar biosynthesis regulator FlaF|nr:flagellar biosynthesis activator protein FlaF [Acetobacteraceae bacterium]